MSRKQLALTLIWLVITGALTPREKFDQALKTSIRDPYADLLSFSMDADGYTLLQVHSDLLKDETMFLDLLKTLKTDLPTRYLNVSLQSHDDYKAEDRFASLRDSLKDIGLIQITHISNITNEEKSSSWGDYLLLGGIIAGSAAAVAVAAPFVVTASVGALGFSATGITAGSTAAGMMSVSGGATVAGSACALLQSIGAAGLGWGGTAFVSTVGAAFGGAASAKVASDQFNKERAKSNNAEGDTTSERQPQGDEKAEESAINDNARETEEIKEKIDEDRKRESPVDISNEEKSKSWKDYILLGGTIAGDAVTAAAAAAIRALGSSAADIMSPSGKTIVSKGSCGQNSQDSILCADGKSKEDL